MRPNELGEDGKLSLRSNPRSDRYATDHACGPTHAGGVYERGMLDRMAHAIVAASEAGDRLVSPDGAAPLLAQFAG
jgi:hypothetical protein